ncbi:MULTISPECIES: MDR family oxidoreductase [unclassified Arsukibacterium]|uniref:acrylyl-CoA reductase (NADPH) n=1 Tax=unclassified Arsukibacterium TaxID=2635278 RepID=UPI000C3B34D8|nr:MULTISPECIES: MDR family oxidoreductase [unclassified Arsukibacterium]MAA96448.1 alcohol dehydrogenase [Rheinheimera sp.]MBM35317.1 alcohol dehydrogenase [Rheinheimera sp.]HAW91869.1 alcohol dehydrogenase [Candidatus Azambacteria bacterium]|tara:strand:+ start:20310 stop:21287 length:978 start_codon:yes stop_codon:yes gene_type:complete
MFKAILINKDEQGYRSVLSDVDEQQLPVADVTVKVIASTINYKDALAITGKAPVVRSFPLVPGIDLVGEVLQSDSDRFNVGDKVLLNGFGVGEGHWGGLAEKACLKSDWLIPLPAGITPEQAMAVGTAGYTAMLCVLALQKHGITPAHGEILVTGANGGVGSYAVRILSKLGYQVVAATGRPEESNYLKKIGAVDILPRSQFSEPGKPLQKERWAGVVDCVGSHTLANACASTRYGGAVAACGLAQGMDFPSSVAPFILRGVTLYGIDSVMRPLADRVQAWQRLSDILSPEDFDTISHVISLDEVIDTASALLEGKLQGRVIVKI